MPDVAAVALIVLFAVAALGCCELHARLEAERDARIEAETARDRALHRARAAGARTRRRTAPWTPALPALPPARRLVPTTAWTAELPAAPRIPIGDPR